MKQSFRLLVVVVLSTVLIAAPAHAAPRRGTLEYFLWQSACISDPGFFVSHFLWCMNPLNSILL